MGTFHQNMGELHGITVVVDVNDGRVLIGRYHEARAGKILLLDVAEHAEAGDGVTNEAYVVKAARLGHWPSHKQLKVPSDDVVQIRRLGEITPA